MTSPERGLGPERPTLFVLEADELRLMADLTTRLSEDESSQLGLSEDELRTVSAVAERLQWNVEHEPLPQSGGPFGDPNFYFTVLTDIGSASGGVAAIFALSNKVKRFVAKRNRGEQTTLDEMEAAAAEALYSQFRIRLPTNPTGVTYRRSEYFEAIWVTDEWVYVVRGIRDGQSAFSIERRPKAPEDQEPDPIE